MFRSSWLCLLCLALAALAGCPGGGTGVGTVPVTGTVTLDGSPVSGASVAFSPKSADGRAAAGVTDASGRFELTTVAGGDGAMPGSYAVTITKAAGQALAPGQDPRSMGGQLSAEQKEAASAAAKQATGAGGAGAGAESAVPDKYASADTSGFTAEVTAGGDNDFTFEMTTQ
jgi:hypothetical protein